MVIKRPLFYHKLLDVFLVVGAITERWCTGLFAHTKPDGSAFFSDEYDGIDTGSLVRTVTEGLSIGTPTGTPSVGFPLHQIDLYGRVPGAMNG